jgi:hypothetical protein
MQRSSIICKSVSVIGIEVEVMIDQEESRGTFSVNFMVRYFGNVLTM